eukprot:COSAG02_NODE_10922_length_1831_cov_1.566975_1_plen_266_part_10
MFTLLISTLLLSISLPLFLRFLLPLPIGVHLLLLRFDLFLARLVFAPGAHRLFVKEIAHRDGKLTCLFLVDGPPSTVIMCPECPVHGFGLATIHPEVARDSIHNVENLEPVWVAVLFLTAVLADHRRDQLNAHAIHHHILHVLPPFVLRGSWGSGASGGMRWKFANSTGAIRHATPWFVHSQSGESATGWHAVASCDCDATPRPADVASSCRSSDPQQTSLRGSLSQRCVARLRAPCRREHGVRVSNVRQTRRSDCSAQVLRELSR